MASATSTAMLPVSMVSSLPPTSLLPPSLIPPSTVTGQSAQELPTTAVTATNNSASTSPTAPVAVARDPVAFSSPSSVPLTVPTSSPGSPSRAAVSAKAVGDSSLNKAAATVIPINDSTVSAAAMLMSIASTNPESSTSTAGSITSTSAATTAASASTAAAAPSSVSSSSPVTHSTVSASPLSPPVTSPTVLSFGLSSPASNKASSTSAFISNTFTSLLSPRSHSPYQSFSPSPFLPTSLASPTLSSSALFSTSSSLFSTSFSSLPSLSSTIPSPLLASIRPGPLTPATTSSLISSLSNPIPKPKPAQPISALDRFVNYLHPLLTTHPGSLAPSLTLPQLRVLATNNFHQLIALAVSVHFNPRRPYPGHRGKEEKLIICRNGWNALRNFISSEREKAWRAEMSGLSVREQRTYKKKRREDRKVANAAIRECRMAKFIDIANEYSINYSAYVKLGDEHSGRLRFRQMKAEQKDAAANALVNSSALISASNVNVAISSTMPHAGPMMANLLPTTLAAVVNEQPLLAAPLTPTTSTSPALAASLPVALSSASFGASAAGQSDVAMSAASATSSSSSSCSSSSGGGSSSEVAAGKRKLDDDGAEMSNYSKKVKAEDGGSDLPVLPPLPTDDELSGLPLLSPKSENAMAANSNGTDGL